MKTEKMSFKNIKDVLSRDEMKKIMAGSGDLCGMCGPNRNWACASNWQSTCQCQVFAGATCYS